MLQFSPTEARVTKRALFSLALLAGLSLLLVSGCKKNAHDNARVPDPYPDKPVQNHKFDGGETDAYGQNEGGGGGGEGGGEKAAHGD